MDTYSIASKMHTVWLALVVHRKLYLFKLKNKILHPLLFVPLHPARSFACTPIREGLRRNEMVVHRRDGPILARHDEHLRCKEVVWRRTVHCNHLFSPSCGASAKVYHFISPFCGESPFHGLAKLSTFILFISSTHIE